MDKEEKFVALMPIFAVFIIGGAVLASGMMGNDGNSEIITNTISPASSVVSDSNHTPIAKINSSPKTDESKTNTISAIPNNILKNTPASTTQNNTPKTAPTNTNRYSIRRVGGDNENESDSE